MPHAIARLMFHGRCLPVQRVRFGQRDLSRSQGDGPVAHRSVARFDAEGFDELTTGPADMRSTPTWTPTTVETGVLRAR